MSRADEIDAEAAVIRNIAAQHEQDAAIARADPARDTRAMLFANVHKNAAKLRRLRRRLKQLAVHAGMPVDIAEDPERALEHVSRVITHLGTKVLEQQQTILAASPARSVTP